MSTIKIKRESLAKRCEICHKSDLFYAEENLCKRCQNLIVTKSDKGEFIINWQVDLSLLTSTLRNFAWQNLDSEVIKTTRIALFLGAICSLILIYTDHQIASTIDQYYIPPLPNSQTSCGEASQTEDFSMWGCGGYYHVMIEDVILASGLFYLGGVFIAFIIYLAERLMPSTNFETKLNLPSILR
ncbi:MAG: hypothetical protein HY819_03315 [Acidobacteria bacterium]|nr:hypothetical protein [Acidobacteriota bacterium]